MTQRPPVPPPPCSKSARLVDSSEMEPEGALAAIVSKESIASCKKVLVVRVMEELFYVCLMGVSQSFQFALINLWDARSQHSHPPKLKWSPCGIPPLPKKCLMLHGDSTAAL